MTKIDPRVAPHNLDAEKAILGTFFLDNEAATKIRSVLNADDFYDPRHQIIYRLVMELVDKKAPIDPVVVINAITQKQMLEKVGGAAYITGLEQFVISPDNVLYHAEIVLDKANKRLWWETANKIGDKAMLDTDSTLAEIQAAVMETSDAIARRSNESRTFSAAELAEETRERLLDETSGNSSDIVIKTNLAAIDRYMYGLSASDLIILAARPSVGKTALALQIATTAARDGHCVLVASLEMSRRLNMNRIMSSGADVDSNAFLKKRYSQEEFSRCMDFLEGFEGQQFHIFDDFHANIQTLRASIISIGARYVPVNLLIVDYLQLMQGNKKENRQVEVAEISRQLKGLTREFNISVLALSQLNRGSEHRGDKNAMPRLADLRESGALEQDADVVLFLHRPDNCQTNEQSVFKLKLIRAKGRQGSVGDEDILFNGSRQTFHDFRLPGQF